VDHPPRRRARRHELADEVRGDQLVVLARRRRHDQRAVDDLAVPAGSSASSSKRHGPACCEILDTAVLLGSTFPL